ncbi:hypothetical protein H4F17_09205 [Vibrio cholerae]
MTNYQIFKKENSVKAIDADKFTARDDINDAISEGYSSLGFFEANSEDEAIELYNQSLSNSGSPQIRKEIKVTENSESNIDTEIPRVSVVDINMPFGSMVVFMIKWAIAAIPAMFVLTLFYMFILSIIGGMF